MQTGDTSPCFLGLTLFNRAKGSPRKATGLVRNEDFNAGRLAQIWLECLQPCTQWSKASSACSDLLFDKFTTPGTTLNEAQKSSELDFFRSNWYGDACRSNRRNGSHGSGNPNGLLVTNVRRCWPSLRTLRLRGCSLRSERFVFLPPPANREPGPMNELVDLRPKHSVTASYRPFVWGLQPLSP